MEDLTNKEIGDWLVLKFEGYRTNRNPYWFCRCKCGNEQPVRYHHLQSGHSTQCRACAGKQMRKFTDTEKYCPRCKEWLPFLEFSNNVKSASGYYGHCKICNQTKRHGITKVIYLSILSKQNGHCAISGCPEPPTQIDHDHACCSGKRSCGKCIRGVLCTKHNLALGLFNDSAEELKKAWNYLNSGTSRLVQTVQVQSPDWSSA